MSESAAAAADLKKRKRNRRIGKIVAFLIRVIGATLRVRYHDKSGFLEKMPDHPVIFAAWHNQIFALPKLYRKKCKGRQMAGLTSASRDGETVSAVLESFKIRAVRGSNSRRGAAALIELKRCFQKNGEDIVITPDGPRGPRHELNGGIITLAQKTKGKLIPLRLEYRSAWKLKTWDKFEIPKPFSRVDVHLCEAIEIPPTETPEAFETQRLHVQSVLRGEDENAKFEIRNSNLEKATNPA